ncbi:MAG: DUF1552 domain-containing protein, partial [Terriglobia bacterium]
AFQTDLTRVITFMMAREKSTRTYRELDIADPHHPLSHHKNDPQMLAKLATIQTFHIKLFSYFLEKLQATRDGDGSLLDRSVILYGAAISDSNKHLHDDLPILLAGGKVQGGRHFRYAKEKETPVTNLLLMMLDKLGVPLDNLGDSTGKLDLLSV